MTPSERDAMEEAREALERTVTLLDEYLREFPKHDQGDFRVWEAAEACKEVLGRVRGPGEVKK